MSQSADIHPYEQATVRILNQGNEEVGTGFLIGPGHILTCTHVVIQAQGGTKQQLPVSDLPIRFDLPLLKSEGPGGALYATPLDCRAIEDSPMPGDLTDIALLTIDKSDALPADTRAATLADSGRNYRRDAMAFGFDCWDGNTVVLTLLGPNATGRVQIEQRPGYTEVKPGFSGAAVWDPERWQVLGMLVSRDRHQGPRTAYMIPGAAFRQLLAQAGQQLGPATAVSPPAEQPDESPEDPRDALQAPFREECLEKRRADSARTQGPVILLPAWCTQRPYLSVMLVAVALSSAMVYFAYRGKQLEQRLLVKQVSAAFDQGDWDRGMATALNLRSPDDADAGTFPMGLITQLERVTYADQRVALVPTEAGDQLIALQLIPGEQAFAALFHPDRGDAQLREFGARAGTPLSRQRSANWNGLRKFWLSTAGERLLGITKDLNDSELKLWALADRSPGALPPPMWSLKLGNSAQWTKDEALNRLLVLRDDGRLDEWSLSGAKVRRLESRDTHWEDLWLAADGQHLAVRDKQRRIALLQRVGSDWREVARSERNEVDALWFPGTSPYPLLSYYRDGEHGLEFLGAPPGGPADRLVDRLLSAEIGQIQWVYWVADDYSRLLVENKEGALVLLGADNGALTLTPAPTPAPPGQLRVAVSGDASRIAYATPAGIQLFSLEPPPAEWDEQPPLDVWSQPVFRFPASLRRLRGGGDGQELRYRDMNHGGTVLCDEKSGAWSVQVAGSSPKRLQGTVDCMDSGPDRSSGRIRFRERIKAPDYPWVRFSGDGTRLIVWSRNKNPACDCLMRITAA